MPIFGVIRLTFDREGGSIKGDEDFFSVARTMPFVAVREVKTLRKHVINTAWLFTFDT
jgi:uncharacterized membrane protein